MDAHYKRVINSPRDLITSHEQTRAGFISFALEKNKRSTPYIESAKSFKSLASAAKSPRDLLNMVSIRPSLLTAAGLSDKSLIHLIDKDKDRAIEELIKNFLEPAGEYFIDEVVYRYLLIKGDSLGGSMRNLVGIIAQQKLIRALLSNMRVMDLKYFWINVNNPKIWIAQSEDDYEIESNLKAIGWTQNGERRVLAFNLSIPIIGKNVDICLFNCSLSEYNGGKIVKNPEKFVMLGELKGGIDPAGADEHWKTANSALGRIRSGCSIVNPHLKTSFVGAAIESSMANEIWSQLEAGILNYAANMTVESQLINYCDWVLSL